MTERPILFSAPMVRAILDGRKTQTRRVLKPINDKQSPGDFLLSAPNMPDQPDVSLHFRPRYQTGDRLWVREAWAPQSVGGAITDTIRYRATSEQVLFLGSDGKWRTDCVHGLVVAPEKWRPSIFMPRWASRIDLHVTGVKVERLQDITEADAIAEGIARNHHGNGDQWADYPLGSSAAGWTDPRDSFRSLWKSINGPDAWGANPWVAAYTFERASS